MNSTPFISILIPCYNAAKFVHQAINSCLSQDYTNFEIILVDDGSTDDTLHVIRDFEKEYANISVFSQQNAGSSSARNLAIQHAKGDYFLYLDTDDVLVPNALINYTKVLKNKKTVVIARWLTAFKTNPAENVESQYIDYPYPDKISKVLEYRPVVSAFFVPKNTILWDEKLRIWEINTYLLEVVLENNFEIAFISDITSIIYQDVSQERVSIKYDHFNMLITAQMAIRWKEYIAKHNKLNPISEVLLDEIIISNAYGLSKISKWKEAFNLLKKINKNNVKYGKLYKNSTLFKLVSIHPLIGLSFFSCATTLIGR